LYEYKTYNKMSTSPYVQKDVSALLYTKNPKAINSITDRKPNRINPKRARSGVAPGDPIEFEFTSDAFIDLASASLCFDLAITGVTGTTNSICNAADVVSRISIFYNDVLCEQINESNSWCNTLLAYSATRSWCGSEGDAILGLSNQVNQALPGAASNGARSYCVPIGLLSGFFRMANYLPLLGNKLRVSFQVASKPSDVVNFTDNTVPGGIGFQLNNISVMIDSVIVQREYRDKILEVMASENGLRIPFSSLQTGKLTPSNSTSQQLRIPNNLSNALSLFMLYDNASAKALTTNQWTLMHQSFPLPSFSSLRVRSGSHYFTPPDDIKSFPELYASAEKCCNSVADISGTGYINYGMQSGLYTKAATIAGGSYGLCLLAVNLEKTLESDDSVMNNGFTASESGSVDFDIQITTTTALSNGDSFLTAIQHKRALVFARSGVVCEV
jgi:hypothetical protein